jgi:hypothetical protein
MEGNIAVDKKTVLRTFNIHFFEFMDDIIRIYPEADDIISGRATFELIKKANPTAIIKVWHKFIYSPYSDVIEKGDITFFFEKDYSEDLAHLANYNEVMGIIDRIRKPIQNMNPLNKAHSTKYIQNLSKLTIMYNS